MTAKLLAGVLREVVAIFIFVMRLVALIRELALSMLGTGTGTISLSRLMLVETLYSTPMML